eukprot:gene43579-58040_t
MLKELLIICLTILSSGVKSWVDASYRSNDSLTNFNQGTESDSQSISISLSLPTGLPTATFDTSTASKSSSPQQLSEIRLSSCQRCIYAARNISQSDDSTTNTNAIHTKTALQVYEAVIFYIDQQHLVKYLQQMYSYTVIETHGQLCHSSGAGPACAMHLPPGEYLWHVGVADYANSDQVAWDFC